MNETDARKAGRQALVGTMPMKSVNRAAEYGQTTGLMKVLVDAESKLILGATLFGLTADEVIHGIIDLMHAKAPYTAIRDEVPIHPTVSELLPTLLEDLKPVE
jgi:pyruvate/2-oxoglutarate dehydrogenase complex dihydrolipoamide dehydrogenase (E3) component